MNVILQEDSFHILEFVLIYSVHKAWIMASTLTKVLEDAQTARIIANYVKMEWAVKYVILGLIWILICQMWLNAMLAQLAVLIAIQ